MSFHWVCTKCWGPPHEEKCPGNIGQTVCEACGATASPLHPVQDDEFAEILDVRDSNAAVLSPEGERVFIARMRLQVDEKRHPLMDESIRYAHTSGVMKMTPEEFATYKDETVRLHMSFLGKPRA